MPQMNEGGGDTPEQAGDASASVNRRSTRQKNWRKWAIVALVAVVVGVGIVPVEKCQDETYICENTGSHKGYRQWCIGLQTGKWCRESHLEQFMRQQHPTELKHRWIYLAGTGRNILGQVTMFSDGRPPMARIVMDLDFFDSYVDTLDNAGKLDLYHVLTSGDSNAIKAENEKIEAALLKIWEMELAGSRQKRLDSNARRGYPN